MAGKRAATHSGNDEPISNGSSEPVAESGNNDGPIDPATLGGAGGSVGEYGDEYERDASGNLVYGKSGQPRRKRGRKGGGANSGAYSKGGKGNTQTVNRGIETLSQTLMIVHMGIASLAEFKQFEIEKAESDALSHS